MAEYDAMGNYTGYDDSYGYDTGYPAAPVAPQQYYDDFGNPVENLEEEKRKREEMERQIEEYRKQQEALGSEVTNKQEVTTYADGSQTITTKREVPAGQKQRPQPVMPDQAAYNQSIAQQESGGRQDIGYHNQQLSSAYGPYGITQGAYEDARRENPALPADIRQATPEQMTAAQNQVTANNARYLQSYGVPVNQNTLQAAHFLGAKGLADYLKTGYISPAAAQANGGVENVKRIVEQRLGGRPAAASGAAQLAPGEQGGVPTQKPRLEPVAPEAEPFTGQGLRAPQQAQPAPTAQAQQIEQYQQVQNDPTALMKLGTDETAPDWLRDRARNRAADLINEQRETKKAEQMLQTATPTDLARYLQGKTKAGEDYNLAARVRAMLFSAAGQKELAMREMDKLDTKGTDKYVQGADGQAYLMRVKANGEILGGYNATTGKELGPEELVKVGAGSMTPGKLDIVGGTYVNDKTGEVGRVVTDQKTGVSYIQTDSGRKPMTGFRPQGQGGTLDMQRVQQVQRQNVELAGDWAKLQMKVQGAAPEAANKFLGEFNAKHGTNFGLASVSGAAPQISLESGQMVQAAPAAAQAAPQAGPVAPTAVAAPQVAAPGAPVAPGQTPAQIQQAETLGTEASKGVIKHRDEKLVPAAAGGQEGSDIVKRQMSVLNDPRSDVLFGLYNKAQSNSKSDKNWAIVRDVLGGKLDTKDTEVSKAIANVKLNPDEMSLLTQLTADNSALATATIRSGGFGAQISDRDRISAEKMQLNIGETPALGMYNGKAQQLFGFDLSRAKSDWAATKDFKTVDQLETAWRKEQARLVDQYGRVADERNAFIKANSDGKPATIGLVREAFKRYPVPQYDPNMNNGAGGWKNLRDRKLEDILKGNR